MGFKIATILLAVYVANLFICNAQGFMIRWGKQFAMPTTESNLSGDSGVGTHQT